MTTWSNTIASITSKPACAAPCAACSAAGLAASLLHRPRVLFLDEPTLGLDVTAQATIRDFIRAYNRRYEATVLLTSHYFGVLAFWSTQVRNLYSLWYGAVLLFVLASAFWRFALRYYTGASA